MLARTGDGLTMRNGYDFRVLSFATGNRGALHGEGHAQNHEMYKDWQRPGGGSCCNAQSPVDPNGDCRPTTAYMDDDGYWYARIRPGVDESGDAKRDAAFEWSRRPVHALLARQPAVYFSDEPLISFVHVVGVQAWRLAPWSLKTPYPRRRCLVIPRQGTGATSGLAATTRMIPTILKIFS